jgi:hypothetical protein
MYALVTSGGGPLEELYPIPWKALAPRPGSALGVDKTLADMDAAPAFSRKSTANLAAAKFRLEIARFYGVPSPIDAKATELSQHQ